MIFFLIFCCIERTDVEILKKKTSDCAIINYDVKKFLCVVERGAGRREKTNHEIGIFRLDLLC